VTFSAKKKDINTDKLAINEQRVLFGKGYAANYFLRSCPCLQS